MATAPRSSTPQRRTRAATVAGLVALTGAALAGTSAAAATAAATTTTSTGATAAPAVATTARAGTTRPAVVLQAGGVLRAGSSLLSGTGYTLVMQAGGNLVEYGPGRVQWASRTHVPGSSLLQQADGDLVMRNPAGKAVWSSHTAGHPGSTLQITAGGDLAVTAPGGAVLWDDQVGADRLAPTGRLTSGHSVASPDGGTVLTMSTNGNLVLRTLVAGVPVTVWASGTAGHVGASVRMRADGVLAVYSAANAVVWTLGSSTAPVHLEVEDGGNARISGPGSALARVASLGDDYPATLRDAPQDSLVDPWLYYSRECVSFAAWRALDRDGVTVYHAGNANTWAAYARTHGFIVDRRPAPGSIAWTDAGSFGHVAVVEKVVGPYLVVEEYNYVTRGEYAHRVVLASRFKAFLHFELPANPAAASTTATTATRSGDDAARGTPGR